MSFGDDNARIMVPTGNDCPVCGGKGTDPKKRTRRCPAPMCSGGKEMKPLDDFEKIEDGGLG